MSETLREQSAAFVKAFSHVCEIYQNVSNMFHATDILMKNKHGFQPYLTRTTVDPKVYSMLEHHNQWLQSSIIRQYFQPQFVDREVVTLAAILFDSKKPGDSVPMLLGSRMEIVKRDNIANSPYWAGQIQRWSTFGPDGQVHKIPVIQPGVPNAKEIRETVVGDHLLSVAIPLLEATDITTIEERVIKPLLAAPWEMK